MTDRGPLEGSARPGKRALPAQRRLTPGIPESGLRMPRRMASEETLSCQRA